MLARQVRDTDRRGNARFVRDLADRIGVGGLEG
jgi:hypothetical protein